MKDEKARKRAAETIAALTAADRAGAAGALLTTGDPEEALHCMLGAERVSLLRLRLTTNDGRARVEANTGELWRRLVIAVTEHDGGSSGLDEVWAAAQRLGEEMAEARGLLTACSCVYKAARPSTTKDEGTRC